MLRKIFRKFDRALAANSVAQRTPEERDHTVRLASAALLIEVARADFDYGEDEFETLLALVQRQFALSAEEAAELSQAADSKVDDSVSLHEFTSVLHAELPVNEKSRIVGMMWQLAFADGRLDKYEDALILKVADLLYVPRSEVMRQKALASSK